MSEHEDSAGDGREITRSDEELGPFTEAKPVNDRVLVRKRRGNLVQEFYLDADDLDAIRGVLEDDE